MQADYNKQPYNSNGDTTGFRNIKWYREQVMPIIYEKIETIDKIAIDVGSGNGRMNQLLHKNFHCVLCFDPVEEQDERFSYANTINLRKMHLHEVGRIVTSDIALFIGSFNIIHETYNEEIWKHIDNILNSTGVIVIVIDVKHAYKVKINDYFSEKSTHLTPDGTTNVIVMRR